ncbi:MAG: thioredoxin TrxA [Alphaproteobacteria bacterium]
MESALSQSTKTITDASFDQDVLKSGEPVLVDFWAEWCGPCKQIGPVLEELAADMKGKITVAKLNVDDNPMTASKFGIRSIPTLMLFKGGELAATKVGGMPKAQLQQWVESVV